jgi:tripartite-type tricarboxylate transporter receptor subunit TctC
MKSIQKILAATALGATGLLSAASTLAAWPEKPVEIIVGFAPGGGTDITARTLAQFLGKVLNTQVIVNNKPGASGAIGLGFVARAQPDGYTLGMTNMPGLLTLPIERDAGFKPSDFTYVANLVRDPSAFSVTLSSPYKNVAELVAAAKKAPGTISYGSTGVGTDDHLQLVMFENLTGTKLLHVPFNGAGPLRTAMMGGHVVIGGLNLGEVMPHSGKTMRVLAQASGTRSKLGSDVQTFKEQGVDLVFASERGIVAPKGIPAEVEQKLGAALRQVAQDPEFQAQMRQQFTEMDYLPGAEWKKRLDGADTGFKQMWAKKPWTD